MPDDVAREVKTLPETPLIEIVEVVMNTVELKALEPKDDVTKVNAALVVVVEMEI